MPARPPTAHSLAHRRFQSLLASGGRRLACATRVRMTDGTPTLARASLPLLRNHGDHGRRGHVQMACTFFGEYEKRWGLRQRVVFASKLLLHLAHSLRIRGHSLLRTESLKHRGLPLGERRFMDAPLGGETRRARRRVDGQPPSRRGGALRQTSLRDGGNRDRAGKDQASRGPFYYPHRHGRFRMVRCTRAHESDASANSGRSIDVV